MNYDLCSTWAVTARHGTNGNPSPCVVGWVERIETDHRTRYAAMDTNRVHQAGGDGWDPVGGGYDTPRHAADTVFARAVAMGWATESTDVTEQDVARDEANRLLTEAQNLADRITCLADQRDALVDLGKDHEAQQLWWQIEDLHEDDGHLDLLANTVASGKPLPDAWLGAAFTGPRHDEGKRPPDE